MAPFRLLRFVSWVGLTSFPHTARGHTGRVFLPTEPLFHKSVGFFLQPLPRDAAFVGAHRPLARTLISTDAPRDHGRWLRRHNPLRVAEAASRRASTHSHGCWPHAAAPACTDPLTSRASVTVLSTVELPKAPRESLCYHRPTGRSRDGAEAACGLDMSASCCGSPRILKCVMPHAEKV